MLAYACVRACMESRGILRMLADLSVLRHALSYVVNKMGFISKASGLGGSRDLFGFEF